MLNYKKYNEYSAVHYTFYDEHWNLGVFPEQNYYFSKSWNGVSVDIKAS